jgi:hypothetical protein
MDDNLAHIMVCSAEHGAANGTHVPFRRGIPRHACCRDCMHLQSGVVNPKVDSPIPCCSEIERRGISSTACTATTMYVVSTCSCEPSTIRSEIDGSFEFGYVSADCIFILTLEAFNLYFLTTGTSLFC